MAVIQKFGNFFKGFFRNKSAYTEAPRLATALFSYIPTIQEFLTKIQKIEQSADASLSGREERKIREICYEFDGKLKALHMLIEINPDALAIRERKRIVQEVLPLRDAIYRQRWVMHAAEFPLFAKQASAVGVRKK